MRLLMAAAAAGGLLMTSYALGPAQAAPLSPATQEAASGVTPVAMRGGGGMRGSGMGMRGRGRGMGIGRPHIGPGRGFRGGTAFRGGPRVSRGLGHGHHGHGHHSHGDHGHHHHQHHHRRFYYAAPFIGYGAYYGDSYYGGSGCGWLRRRAEATGSGYWWSRYEECLDENS